MPIRDIVLSVVMLVLLPAGFLHPWIGILVWSWLGYMNPHRQVWGFARDMPWAMLVALAVLAGIPFAKDRKPIPWLRETFLLAALWGMYSLTTLTAMYPDEAWEQWQKVSKVLLFTFITMMFFQDRRRLRCLFLVIALSLGFYGLKGGVFSVLTGGQHRVQGPDASFFAGNTTVGVAMLMALPFLYYLQEDEPRKWLRHLLRITFWASAVAVIFTYSRGAMLGLPVVLGLLFLKRGGGRRLIAGISAAVLLGGLFLAVAPYVIPQKWWDRMATIQSYEEEGSAMSRLKAWKVAYQLASDRPLTGGGFLALEHEEIYLRYGAPWGKHSAHSIYFGVLGDHGFIALGLFVSLILLCFWSLFTLRWTTRRLPSGDWFRRSALMLEASLAAYAVTGAFFTLAYFDLFYHLVSLVVMLRVLARQEIAALKEAGPATAVLDIPGQRTGPPVLKR